MHSGVIRCLAMGAVSLAAACGNAPEANGRASRDAASQADPRNSNGALSGERAAGPAIPAAFHGRWDMRASDSCMPGEPRYVVGKNWTSAWTDERNLVASVRIIDANSVELKGEDDPAAPGADQRYGLSLGEGGNAMTLSAPGMSSMNFVRCNDGSPDAPRPNSPGTILTQIPERFRGHWDDATDPEFACSNVSTSGMRVQPLRLQYYEGREDVSEVRRIDADTIELDTRYAEFEEPTSTTATVRLTISAGGEKLTYKIEGYDPFAYIRC